MPRIWFYHYKMRKRVYVEIEDVWPNKFKRFAEIITIHYEKITDHFGINQAAKEAGIEYETAKGYLKVLAKYGIIKRSPTLKEDSYILACTPEEEIQAKRESNSSQLAAGAFTKVKQKAQDWPLIAACARELQRIKERFGAKRRINRPICESDGNKMDSRREVENEEGLNEMRRELREKYEILQYKSHKGKGEACVPRKITSRDEMRREIREKFEELKSKSELN